MGSGGIFSEHINMQLAAAALIGLCIFTLIFEEGTQRLERAFAHAPHYTDMIQKVWRELMILGFISLMVVLANEFQLIHNHDMFLAFEFSHLLIFGVSMFYTVTAVVTANRLAYTEAQWYRIANLDTNLLVDRLEEVLNARSADDNAWKGFAPLWQSLILDMVKVVDRWEDAEWKMCRLLFLREFGLGNDFDYSKYMKMRLHHKLSHSLHVHPTTWSLVCGFSALFYLIKYVTNHLDDSHAITAEDASAQASDAVSSLGTLQSDTVLMRNDTNVTEFMGHTSLTEDESVLAIFIPAMFGWILLGSQCFVLYKVKIAIHKTIKAKGCPNVHELPETLRKINAEVEMKYQIPRMWVFADSGDDFVEALIEEMEMKFFASGDVISEVGCTLESLVIFGHGGCDIKTQDGRLIGNLGKGDYIGEASLLRPEDQSTSIIAKDDVTIFTLNKSSLTILQDFFPSAVQRLLEFGEQKYKSSFGLEAPPDDGVLKEWQDKLQAKQQQMQDNSADLMAATMAGKAKSSARQAAAQAGKAAMVATYRTAKNATKKVVKSVGLPGSGHGVEAGHGNPDRMTGADEIMSKHTAHTYAEISEIALLFNCFTLGYWLMHLMPVVIPTYFAGTIPSILAHVMVLLP